ncbi:MAG: glycosyltransferase [Haliscomenobacteraceae bacterium CHB4]|nr:hypothetical protein [Saprospiraceae bacterium]MCE7925925.1 glycosyltransferase [Haliscomenobacteraceae bacterium CHB4]
MQQPLVSCILPTYNRRPFLENAIRYFQRQDYAPRELIILDDGTDPIEDLVPAAKNIRYCRLEQKITLGAKLNLACSYAKGDIIANWDDDDWYAPRRLTYQMQAMQQKGISVCGINKLLYLDLESKQTYQYIYPAHHKTWLSGSTLCFTKEIWEKIRFADINVGMDGLFVWAAPPDQLKVLEDNTFSVHMIHGHNVSPKKIDGIWWRPHPAGDLQRIMGDDWKFYSNGHHKANLKINGAATAQNGSRTGLLKNVHACLVHEDVECILDLVRNLHYCDPDSVILLYNGSTNPHLIPRDFPCAQYGAVVHPNPKPQQHGYLHHFALDCMSYAVENLSFDTLTVVDSDQLAVRPGYTPFLAACLSQKPRAGLLSSAPERVKSDDKTRLVALQAYKEFDLWKPFLQQFPDGENQFVHWTFWPSTVFTRDAIRDLLRLFKENKLLQGIMEKTKIWATEEVIFPTLIKLLGYDVISNPCRCDFVQYRKAFTAHDADRAMQLTDVYWMHPVQRQIEHPLRRHIRTRLDGYQKTTDMNNHHPASPAVSFQAEPLIRQIRRIEGWLSDEEAHLMIKTAIKALGELPPHHRLVEVGSYHGKSTVLLGSVAKTVSPGARVCAIDPHNGLLGAADQGLQSFPPSLASFRKNIAEAGLSDITDVITDYSFHVAWSDPISLLYIDGLHDYENVIRDFRQFADWVRPGGYAIFHDYADYFPGVKQAVHEILETKMFRKTALAGSLIVLQKIENCK